MIVQLRYDDMVKEEKMKGEIIARGLTRVAMWAEWSCNGAEGNCKGLEWICNWFEMICKGLTNGRKGLNGLKEGNAGTQRVCKLFEWGLQGC